MIALKAAAAALLACSMVAAKQGPVVDDNKLIYSNMINNTIYQNATTYKYECKGCKKPCSSSSSSSSCSSSSSSSCSSSSSSSCSSSSSSSCSSSSSSSSCSSSSSSSSSSCKHHKGKKHQRYGPAHRKFHKKDGKKDCKDGVCHYDHEFFTVPAVSHKGAMEACHKHGGMLADVTIENFLQAANAVYKCVGANEEAWVNSWNGDRYKDSCLVLHTGSTCGGGSINTAKCCSHQKALCMKKKHHPEPKCEKDDKKCYEKVKVVKKCVKCESSSSSSSSSSSCSSSSSSSSTSCKKCCKKHHGKKDHKYGQKDHKKGGN